MKMSHDLPPPLHLLPSHMRRPVNHIDWESVAVAAEPGLGAFKSHGTCRMQEATQKGLCNHDPRSREKPREGIRGNESIALARITFSARLCGIARTTPEGIAAWNVEGRSFR